MGKQDFSEQLKALGYDPQELDALRVAIEYEVPVGGNIGKRIMLGFEVANDFPMNCPTGPHIKALAPGWIEHRENIQSSPAEFGPGWRYWSRPFKEWSRTDRTVKTYLAHIKNVMTTV